MSRLFSLSLSCLILPAAFCADEVEELPPASRVAADASALSEAAGEAAGPAVLQGLMTALDSESGDDERIEAAQSLLALEGLPAETALRIGRRAELVVTGVTGLKQANADAATRAAVNELLLRVAVDYENGNASKHAARVRELYRALRTSAPQTLVALEPVFVRHYFNYNVHLVASESLITKVVSDARSESGNVADCILGAWVTGRQVTDSTVTADIRPSSDRVALDLVVHGRTRTNTQGRKSPAIIYSRGNHTFTIRKQTWFDGETVSADAAKMNVRMNNRTTGASTDFDDIPLFNTIARKIAIRAAARKAPEADAIAAQKLKNRALPKFEEESVGQLDKANAQYGRIMSVLNSHGIEPTTFSTRSTDTHLAVSSRTIGASSLAAPRAPAFATPASGLSLQIHQSAVNSSLDSLGFKGRMTAEEVVSRIEERASALLDREVTIDRSNLDQSTSFEFNSGDPLRVNFTDGHVIIVLRTGFVQMDRNRTVPPHELKIPLKVELDGDVVRLIPPSTETSSIVKLAKPLGVRPSPRAVIQARTVIRELLEKTFQGKDIETTAVHHLGEGDGALELRTTAVQIQDGWLSIGVE